MKIKNLKNMIVQESAKRLYQLIKSMPDVVYLAGKVEFNLREILEEDLQRMVQDINLVEIESLNLNKEELIEKIEKELEILRGEYDKLQEEKDPNERRFRKEILRARTVGSLAKRSLIDNDEN
jgi:predicted RecB family endonuclease